MDFDDSYSMQRMSDFKDLLKEWLEEDIRNTAEKQQE